MITTLEPERGGENEGIVRVELSLPMHPDELRELRDWLHRGGWPIEVEQIDAYLAGEEWQA